MMTLEERLRTAIKSGNLLHLSLNRKWDGSLWQCGYRNGDTNHVSYVEDADPIVAMEKAIRPLRSPKPEPVHFPTAKELKRRRSAERNEDLI